MTKRFLSMALVLTIMITLLIPSAGIAVQDDSYKVIYDKIRNHDLAKKLQGLNIPEGINIDSLISLFLEKAPDAAKKTYNALDPEYTGMLEEKYLLTKDNAKQLVEIINGVKNDNLNGFKQLVKDVKDNKTTPSQETIDFVLELKSTLLEEMPVLASHINTVLVDPSQKADLVLDYANIIFKNGKAIEDKDGNLTFTVKGSNAISQLVTDLNTKLKEGYKLPVADTRDAINVAIEKLGEEINAFLQAEGNELYKAVAIPLLKAIGFEVEEYTEPGSGGPGGGGGGGSSTPKDEPKEPTVPADPELPVTLELDEKNVIVEEKDGTSIVTVDEDALVEAIKKVSDAAKEASEGRKAEVVLHIEDATDANLNFVLSSNAVDAMKDSNVDLVVKSNDIEYHIPAGLLENIDIPEGATVEFKSKEVDANTVSELAGLDGEAKKVIELTLQIVTKDGTENVTSFSRFLTVRISAKGLGDPDKLVVYYVNEETGELEFVTGKIKDDMLVMKLAHYSKYAVVERNVTFSDIQSHWAKSYIESMAAKHIIDGMGGGIYAPNAKVTRAQFVKLLVGALELDVVKYNGEFTDVKVGEWYSDFVATAVANGLVEGYTDGTFKPNDEISRLEMAVMLSRALKDVKVNQVEENNNVSKFADSKDIANWAREGVAIAVKAKLMEGVPGNRFAPKEVSNRAEAATVIYRLFNR